MERQNSLALTGKSCLGAHQLKHSASFYGQEAQRGFELHDCVCQLGMLSDALT